MYLDRAIQDHFSYPACFADILQITANCQITELEKRCLNSALILLAESLKADAVIIDDQVSIIFTDSSDLVLRNDDSPSNIAWYHQFICFYVHRWRERQFDAVQIVVTMLEELTHCFYRIADERLVKEKVTEVVRTRFPDATLQTLYDFLHPDNSV